MNIKDIQENFIKIYGGEEKNIRSFSVCASLRLAGVNTDGFDCLSLSVSPVTTAVIREKNDGMYSIINADNDIMYQCKEDKLLDYGNNKELQNLFRAIALTKGNIKGAEILLNYSVDQNSLKNPEYALCTAFSLISKNTLPAIGEITALTDNSSSLDTLTECILYGRKNTVTAKNKNCSCDSLAFYLNGYKLIIMTVKNTKETTSKIIKETAAKLNSNNAKQENEYVRFCANEQQRAAAIRENLITYKTVNSKLADILKSSAYELCSITGKYGATILDAYKTAEGIGLAEAVFAAYDYSGICAIVCNSEVDNFIASFSDLYQRRIGTEPEFYICDTADSGIELTVDEYVRKL